MKAETVVRDALQEIGQQAAEQPVKADEMATAIRYMNRFMFGFAYLGLGYTVVTSSSQEITIPDYAHEWLILGLAKRLIPSFPSVDDSTKADIRDNYNIAYNNLLLQNGQAPEMSFPSTLPVGSGNENCYGEIFYPEDENNILQENGDNILLEG